MARSHSQLVKEFTDLYKAERRRLISMAKRGATLDAYQMQIVNTPPSKMNEPKYKDWVRLTREANRRTERAKYTDPETGKTVSWKRHEYDMRVQSARKGARTKANKGKKPSQRDIIEIIDERMYYAWMDYVHDYLQEEREQALTAVNNRWNKLKATIIESNYQSSVLKQLERYEHTVQLDLTTICEDSDGDKIQQAMYNLIDIFAGIDRNRYASEVFDVEEIEDMMGGGG